MFPLLDTWACNRLWTTSRDIFVARLIERCQTTRAILFGLSAHEIRPQEKGEITKAYPPARTKVTAKRDKLSY